MNIKYQSSSCIKLNTLNKMLCSIYSIWFCTADDQNEITLTQNRFSKCHVFQRDHHNCNATNSRGMYAVDITFKKEMTIKHNLVKAYSNVYFPWRNDFLRSNCYQRDWPRLKWSDRRSGNLNLTCGFPTNLQWVSLSFSSKVWSFANIFCCVHAFHVFRSTHWDGLRGRLSLPEFDKSYRLIWRGGEKRNIDPQDHLIYHNVQSSERKGTIFDPRVSSVLFSFSNCFSSKRWRGLRRSWVVTNSLPLLDFTFASSLAARLLSGLSNQWFTNQNGRFHLVTVCD